ncbi:EAL domain-containing protein [Bacillus sp. PS06]|nr:EAL domain-containing protein [Bacillus sp. PS06]
MHELDLHYNNWVIILSYLIAVLASYSALNMMGKIYSSKGTIRLIWMISGSLVMGSGIWSMHFVGMLASYSSISFQYDPFLTLISAISAVIASYIAFCVVTYRKNEGLLSITIAGFLMGCGIIAMHYIGMAAIQTEISITYDPFLWVLSAMISFVAAYAALFLFIRFRNQRKNYTWKMISALIMGVAICGMHYTGMSATSMHIQDPHLMHHTPTGVNRYMVLGVSFVMLFILVISWIAIFLDRHLLEKMAYRDSLTLLLNRNGLLDYFDSKKEVHGSIMFIDLDRFKTINDTLGHDIGDLLLIEVAKRLKNCVGHGGEVFRLGGDEFLIITKEIKETQLLDLSHKILSDITKACFIQENELYITASIGIATSPIHGTDRKSLMRRADTAMYHAKNNGKNGASIFTQEMEDVQIRRMALEKDLKKALIHQEFFILYQPKWDSNQDKMVGLEALLRWNHPELGLISPMEFIPISEETGIIVPITHWMLESVCWQNKSWQDSNLINIPISVNMSIRLFESNSLVHVIRKALKKTELEAKYLELEITESIAMNEVENTMKQLQELRSLGVRISMDDFGTGYSSLGSLDEFPIDILKIDQSFIRKINIESKKAIIHTIIMMAHNLNMEVIAEGVETMEQVSFLKANGCNLMQGYFYGKPSLPINIEEMLMKKRLQPN